MYLKNLYLENFRNYTNCEFKFSKGTNILYGLNGQGKTNIIESLYFFFNGKSYRTSKDNEVINFEKDFARIKIDFFDGVRDNTSEIFINEKKSVKINDIPISKLSEIIGMLNMVIFTPDMLNIIKDGPGVRRQFMDMLISQLKPVYFKTLINYYKVLMQRNNILKSRNNKLFDTIDVWNDKLAEYGIVINKYRNNIIKELDKYISMIDYNGESENTTLKYSPSIKEDFEDKENFVKQLEKCFEREKEKGITLLGPHRDDFDIFLNERSIRKFGSQGQMRTCVLKLKLAECGIIRDTAGHEPILLLDDILSELDEKRKEFFLNNIKDRQIFITCTERENIKHNESRYFNIENGNIKRID